MRLGLEPLEPRLLLAQVHSGSIAADETWTAADVHRITGDVTVEPGVTLTIEAGAIVQFDSSSRDLFVKGTLLAPGTVDNPILFTSLKDDTGPDGVLGTADDVDTGGDGPTQGAKGQWGSIQFTNSSTGSVLDFVQIRYGGAGATAVVIADGELTLRNSLIHSSSTQGLRIVTSSPTLTNITLRDNTQAAMSMDLVSDPAIRGVSVENNGVNGLQLDGGVMAQSNRWDDHDIIYVLSNDITVAAGATLSVTPGQIVAASSKALLVNGTLDARGTAEQPIIFTSTYDTPRGIDIDNYPHYAPARGNWKGIRLEPLSVGNVLEHVEIRYAGTSIATQAALVTAAPLTFRNSVIRDSYEGLRIAGSNPVVAGVTFRNNVRAAVSMDLVSDPAIRGVSVENNGVNGLQLDGGAMPQSNRWDDPDIIYVLSNDITVAAGATLSVAPGQIVAASSKALLVNGTLDARGTAEQPIIFTSTYDTPRGIDIDNYPHYAPARGNWKGIRLEPLSVGNVLEHVEIRYAGTSIATQAAIVTAAPLTLRNSVIRDSYEGLRIAGSNPVVAGVTFQNNVRAAVSMDLVSDPAIRGVSVENNGVNGLQLDGGVMAQSNRWDDPDIVYVLKGDITVAAGATLSVAPGQIVAASSKALLVNGTLDARGTAEQPILFTSSSDTPRGIDIDNAAYTPAYGSWKGIRLEPTSVDNVLEHIEIRYAGTSVKTQAALVTAAPLALRNSVIRDSYEGLRIAGSNPVVAGVTFQDNVRAAVSMDVAANPDIRGVSLRNNGINGVQLDGGVLPGETLWNNTDVVYWLEKSVTVPEGLTLRIAPGQVIAPKWGGVGLLVEGTLAALGTADRPIIFTSVYDDSLGVNIDNANYVPAHGQWGQVQFTSKSVDNVLEYCELRYGGGAAAGTVFANGGPLEVRNSIIRDNWDAGLTASNGAQVHVANSLIVRTGHANDSERQSNVVVSGGAVLRAFNNVIDSGEVGIIVEGATAVLVNNLITNSTWYGIEARSNPTIAASFNDVYNNRLGNYRGWEDLTGTAGNISADPLYFNQPGGQYQLRARSPAIDAGTSEGAPPADRDGRPRFDDPHVPNRGGGAQPYVDLGPYERQQTSGPSDVDLAVTSARGPAAGLQDDTVAVAWTVQNVGTGTAVGAWRDAVYLSADPVWTPDDVLLGDKLHSGDLGPGQTYEATANLALPGVLPGDYYFLVRTNWQNEVYEGNSLLNNRGSSADTISLDVPTLTPGVARNGALAATGGSKLYKLNVAAGASLQVELTGPAGVTHELYVKHGDAPTRQDFDQRAVRPGTANQSVSWTAAQGGPYYVLVYGAEVPVAETFTVTAMLRDFGITRVSPERGSNLGQVTVSLGGALFTPDATVRMIDGSGSPLDAQAVYFTDSGLLAATFDLRGRPAGLAALQVIRSDGSIAAREGAFEILVGQPGRLVADLIAPGRVRLGRTFEFTVEFANQGDTDIPVGLLRVASAGSVLVGRSGDAAFRPSLQLLTTTAEQPAGVLRPGQRGSVKLYASTTDATPDGLRLDVAEFPEQPIDWASLKDTMRPAGTEDQIWDPLFVQIETLVGQTWRDYEVALSRYVSLLGHNPDSAFGPQEAFLLLVEDSAAALGVSLSGTVRQSDTGAPVGGVDLVFAARSSETTYAAVSRADGSFRVAAMAPGEYELRVPGYGQQVAPGTVSISNADVDGIEILVARGGSIWGTVVAEVSGIPLANIGLSALGASGRSYPAFTDSRGNYRLASLPDGDYTILVHGGVYADPPPRSVTLGNGTAQRRANFSLAWGGTLRGTVTGPAGPLAGAWVSAVAATGHARGAATDALGNFELAGLAAGTFTVTASASGMIAARASHIPVAAGETVAGVDLRLEPGGGLNVTVVTVGDQRPVSDAVVSVSNGETTLVAATGEDGTVQITGLPAGTYTIETAGGDFMTAATAAEVTVGATATAQLEVAPAGTIQGQLTRLADGLPLAKVVVYVTGADGLLASTVTGDDGTYRFAPFDAGDYRIVVGDADGPGVASRIVALAPNTPLVEASFSVDVVGSISGRVLQADGTTPLEGAVITLVEANQPRLDMLTQPDGSYTLLLVAPGTYAVQASSMDYVFPPRTGLVITVGADHTGVDFIAGDETIRGSVYDQAAGVPLAEASVRLLRQAEDGSLTPLATTFTAADGGFAFANSIAGSYVVYASATDHAPQRQAVDLAAGVVPDVRFDLAAERVLRGTITGASGLPLAAALILIAETGDDAITWSALTDEAGQYEIARLAAGSYGVTVLAAGHEAYYVQDVGLNQPVHTLDVTLAASTIRVAGVVLSAHGPAYQATVTAYRDDGSLCGYAVTDVDGSFELTTLAGGNYTLFATAAAHRPSTGTPLAVAPADDLDNLVLEISPVGLSDPAPNEAEARDASGPTVSLSHFLKDPRLPEFEQYRAGLAKLQAYKGGDPTCVRAKTQAAIHFDFAKLDHDSLKAEFETARQLVTQYKKLETRLTKLNMLETPDPLTGKPTRGELRNVARAMCLVLWYLGKLQVDPKLVTWDQFPDITPSDLVWTFSWTAKQAEIEGILAKDGPLDQLTKLVNRFQRVIEEHPEGFKVPMFPKKPVFVDQIRFLLINSAIQQALPRIGDTLREMRDVTARLLFYEKLLGSYQDNLDKANAYLRVVERYCTSDACGGSGEGERLACRAAGESPTVFPQCPVGPPPPPVWKKMDEEPITKVTSVDPNDKIGPAGVGPEGFVRPGVLPYEVQFENDPLLGATVAAQEVFVTDMLAEPLDLSTLEFTRFGFNNLDFDVPPGLSHYETTLDLRPHGIELLVYVSLSVDLPTRELSAQFRSLDPLTLDLPDDVDAGFLPVNDKQLHNGEGYFRYRIQPLPGLPSGTAITNQASIVFDINAPILTPQTLHTLDVGSPTSVVRPLPPTVGTAFEVSWEGTDDLHGSGVAAYDIYVSDDGGLFQRWQTATAATSAMFTGEVGHTYRFYSMAVDHVGHREAEAATFDTETQVVAVSNWQHPLNRFDVDGNGKVEPQDVLRIINYINAHPNDRDLPAPPQMPPPYYNVNGDQEITAADVLAVINYLNAHPAGAPAGESDTRLPTAEVTSGWLDVWPHDPPAAASFGLPVQATGGLAGGAAPAAAGAESAIWRTNDKPSGNPTAVARAPDHRIARKDGSRRGGLSREGVAFRGDRGGLPLPGELAADAVEAGMAYELEAVFAEIVEDVAAAWG
jgi:5-hydroxyisourate hydrolase-like protein (transthyretin family)